MRLNDSAWTLDLDIVYQVPRACMIMMVSRWRVRDIIPIVWPEIIIYKNRQLTVDIETRRQWSLIISWEQRDHLLGEETNVAIPDEATSSRHSSSTALTSPNILIQPNSYPSTSNSRSQKWLLSCVRRHATKAIFWYGWKVRHQLSILQHGQKTIHTFW